VSILRFAVIRPAPSHANFGIKSKAKLANILMLVRFLALGSADMLLVSYKREPPTGGARVSPLVMASGPATIAVSAPSQLLAVLMLLLAYQLRLAMGPIFDGMFKELNG
jgi:hypothetical protein